MIHVVLGMHKSGTTLVSQILHHSGIVMVEEADPAKGYDEGNQWEREATKSVNHALLGSEGLYSLRVRRRGPLGTTPELRSRMAEITATCSARHPDWGFKDPRTCLTYEEWARVLPEHVITVVYRRPEEAWAHYWESTRGRRRLTVCREFLAAWCEYNAAIIGLLRTTSMPWIVLPYARLMESDAEFHRLETFIGRPLTDRRQPGLRRSRGTRRGIYDVVRAWHACTGGVSPESIATALDDLASRGCLPNG
jgi:hypothetical protein